MRAFVGCVVIAITGCAAAQPSSSAPSRQGRRGPAHKGPNVGDIARRALKTSVGKPFEKRSAKVRALPVSAGGVFVSNLPIVGGNALVGTSTKHWGAPSGWVLVDLKTGAARAKVKTVGEGSAATKTAVVTLTDGENARPALLHLDTGKIVEAAPQLPDHAKVTGVKVIVDRKRPVTWMIARRADGRAFHAEWKDTSDGKLAMTDALAFWPTQTSGKNGVQAWHEIGRAGTRGTGDCDRVVLDPQDPPRCRPLPSTEAAPHDLVEECVRSDGDAWLVDDCAGRTPVGCGPTAHTLWISPDPSRVLAVCTPQGEAPSLMLWSPKQSWAWKDDPSVSWRNILSQRGPRSVVGLEQFTQADAAVKRWLDLDKGVLLTGPPMRGVLLSEKRDDRRRLVQPPDKLNELWLLDVDAGTLERIADDIDCDTPLFQYAQTGERATIECLPKAKAAELYKDDGRLASWKWMEVLDLTRRIRWRTTEVFEAKIGPDGVVVGTKRGKPATAAVLETP